MSNYPVHTAHPSKRYARWGIYHLRRIYYLFPLEGSPEVELSCPQSASIQTLRQVGHLLSTHGTLLLLMKGHTEDELFSPHRHLLVRRIIYSP